MRVQLSKDKEGNSNAYVDFWRKQDSHVSILLMSVAYWI